MAVGATNSQQHNDGSSSSSSSNNNKKTLLFRLAVVALFVIHAGLTVLVSSQSDNIIPRAHDDSDFVHHDDHDQQRQSSSTKNAAVEQVTTEEDDMLLPVIYIYQAQPRHHKTIPAGFYMWEAICTTLDHNNTVILLLIAPDDEDDNPMEIHLPTCLQNHDRLSIRHVHGDHPLIQTFRNVYQVGWGFREPFERICMERFFVLQQFMEQHNLQQVFYLDADVILKTPLTTRELLPHVQDTTIDGNKEPQCDGLVSFGDKGKNRVDKHNWSIYVGAGAVMSLDMLTRFVEFQIEMYKPPYKDVLKEKFEERPYVTDMAMWYFFIVATDADYRHFEAHDTNDAGASLTKRLPPVNQTFKYCNSNIRGFDEKHGHLKEDKGVSLKSIHYQGNEKKVLRKLAYLKQHEAAASISNQTTVQQ